ncbi:MAG: cysteine desulfurase [Clostridiales bacterium]|nr:cysteine desulfurase [Clostridiales bacterium]
MKVIYFDNASTTPLDSRVLDAMTPYLTNIYGNANSTHSIGRDAVRGLDDARATVADILGANFNEIYFTSGGSESNNFAMRGSFFARGDRNKLIISSIEHHSVLVTASELEKLGANVIKISPNCQGELSVNDYKNAGLDDCFLACMMTANNEIGTIEPIKEFASTCKTHGALSFTDCVQGMGVLDINVKELGVDMLSFSAHKFGGPKGMGVLYIKNGTPVSPLITGGSQERGKRGGTSNVAGAVGLATALKLSRENLNEKVEYIRSLRDRLKNRILTEIPNSTVNGSKMGVPGILNVTFNGINGETLLYNLDINGVCASMGSACTAGTIDPSHVLKEIGLSQEQAKSSIRFSLSSNNTIEEVDKVVEIIKKSI